MDNKPLGGIDKIIGKTLPSYIKGDLEDVPEYLRKKSSRPAKEEEWRMFDGMLNSKYWI